MDEELELIDPDHPDAQDAATATARLLIAIHEQRQQQTTPDDVPTTKEE
jgi:hypothetical protein